MNERTQISKGENPDVFAAGKSQPFTDSETQFFSDSEFDSVVGDSCPDLHPSKAQQQPSKPYVPEMLDSHHQEIVDLILPLYYSKYLETSRKSLAIVDARTTNCCEVAEVAVDLKSSRPDSVKYTLSHSVAMYGQVPPISRLEYYEYLLGLILDMMPIRDLAGIVVACSYC